MKSTLRFLILLFAGVTLLQKNASAQTYISVESEAKKIVLRYKQDYIFQDSIKLTTSKKNKVEVEDVMRATLVLDDREIPIFLENHDDLKVVDFDGQVTFEKLGGANNTFLQIYEQEAAKYKAPMAKSVDIAEIQAFDFRKKMKKLMSEYPRFDFISKRFQKFLEVENEYRYHSTMIQNGFNYKRTHRVPDEMVKSLRKDDFTDKEKLVSTWYRTYLFEYSAFQALRDNGFELPKGGTGMYVLHSYWIGQNVKDQSAFNLDKLLIKEYYQDMDPVVLKNTMKKHEKDKTPTTERLLSLVGPRMNLETEDFEIETSTEESNQLDLTAVDLDGKEVKLSDFKNKVVYVDIWASWCGPCRKEFPHAKKLKENLGKKALKNIVFLYISIDETESKWKGAVEKIGMKGEHWNSKGGWGSDAVRYFGVGSIPRYVIIGKDGKILESNAPRPSNAQITELLTRLALKK